MTSHLIAEMNENQMSQTGPELMRPDWDLYDKYGS